MSRVLRPARHIAGHFGDESFQAITCTGTDNSKQTGENTPKTHRKQSGPRQVKHTKHPKLNLNMEGSFVSAVCLVVYFL